MSVSVQKGRPRHRFTVEQFRRMGEAGVFDEDDRVELMDGEIVEMTPIGSRHAGYVNRLNRLFHERVDEAVVSVQNPVELGEFTEVRPDVAVLRDREDSYTGRLPDTGDVWLIVEVADSSLEGDRDRKVPLYAEHDVPVVWLVNLVDEVVEVFEQPADDGYADVEVVGEGRLEVESVPGLAVEMAELFV